MQLKHIITTFCLLFVIGQASAEPNVNLLSPGKHKTNYSSSGKKLESLISQPMQKYLIAMKKPSYYGQRSEKTRRPKTVPVRQYRKKNGTIVHKHYRSPPRGKSSKKK